MFDLAATDRAMAQPVCIRTEVSGSVSNVAVPVLVSPAESEQGFVHLAAAYSTSKCNSLLLPHWSPCSSLPTPPSPTPEALPWVPWSGAFSMMLHQAIRAALSRLECLAPDHRHLCSF